MPNMVNVIQKLIRKYYFFSMEKIVARNLRFLKSTDNICDFGCGDGEFFLRLNEIAQVPNKKMGCDIYLPALIKLKNRNVYKWLIRSDLKHLPFKTKSLDVVIACHVIEHVKKRDDIIKELDRITRKKLIIITPKGFTPFSDYEYMEENIYQKHHSGYEIEDFIKYNFLVYGIGSRFVCGKVYKQGKLPVPLRRILSCLSVLLTAVTYYCPRYANHILCVKDNSRPLKNPSGSHCEDGKSPDEAISTGLLRPYRARNDRKGQNSEFFNGLNL